MLLWSYFGGDKSSATRDRLHHWPSWLSSNQVANRASPIQVKRFVSNFPSGASLSNKVSANESPLPSCRTKPNLAVYPLYFRPTTHSSASSSAQSTHVAHSHRKAYVVLYPTLAPIPQLLAPRETSYALVVPTIVRPSGRATMASSACQLQEPWAMTTLEGIQFCLLFPLGFLRLYFSVN